MVRDVSVKFGHASVYNGLSTNSGRPWGGGGEKKGKEKAVDFDIV